LILSFTDGGEIIGDYNKETDGGYRMGTVIKPAGDYSEINVKFPISSQINV
jgi:hypothetical protein